MNQINIRCIVIGFHIALIIWIVLTFNIENTPEHWLQVILIFVNCILGMYQVSNLVNRK